MSDPWHPTFEEFLAVPAERAASIAPATMIYSCAGSRRAAAIAGVSDHMEYMFWSRLQMLTCFELFFRFGVRHLLVPMLMPTNFSEITPGYREKFEASAVEAIAGHDILAYWQRQGWRVRLLGGEGAPAFRPAAARLEAETARESQHTLWYYVVPEIGMQWEWVLAAAARSGARTQAEAARALYGEDIPPATLFLSFNKPLVNPDLLPPLLVGDLQCYWTQKPGYNVTEADFRRVLYDYAFLRRTWKEDKTGRAEQAQAQRAIWENGPILGLGRRFGPFWYPQHFADPAATPGGDG